jgi:hypothetical protein
MAKRTGWTEADFAPEDPDFQGEFFNAGVEGVAKHALTYDTKTKVLRSMRYCTETSKFGYVNVDMGTEAWVSWPSGNNAWVVPPINEALNHYAFRITHSTGDVGLYNKGMYVLVDIDRANQRWHIRRLNNQIQATYPTLAQWLNGVLDNPTLPQLLTARQTALMTPCRAVGLLTPTALQTAARPAAPHAAPAGARQLIPLVAPPSKRHKTNPAPVESTTPPFNPTAQRILAWLVGDCVKPTDTPTWTSVPVDDLMALASLILGCRLEGPARAAVLQAFCDAGCVESKTTQGQTFVNGRGLSIVTLAKNMVAPTPPHDLVKGGSKEDILARTIAGEVFFKSKAEREHFLFLSYFFKSVQYEQTSIKYALPDGGRQSYTPDFYLPMVSSLENPTAPGSRGVLVETKSDYPTREEIRKCLNVTATGRSIVIMYGYAKKPLSETRVYSEDPTDRPPPAWFRVGGIKVMTFENRDGRPRIKCRDNLWCIDNDGDLPCLRPLDNVDDYGSEHPTLLRIYQDIAQI